MAEILREIKERYTKLEEPRVIHELTRRVIARFIDRPLLMSTLAMGIPREGKSAWLTMETGRVLRNVITSLVTRGDWVGARLVGHDDQP